MSNPNKRPKYLIWLLVLLTMAIPLIYYFAFAPDTVENSDPKTSPKPKPPEPEFVNEGSLDFISEDGEVLATIDIEVADTEPDRNQGMMYRRSMADSLGMLFIFPRSEPRAFWMKNTYISLDIIFVDDSLRIVTIQKNALPFSEKSLPSSQPARYIVEVVGGFCDRQGIKEGDLIKFDFAT